ncbi:MAG TPA: tetratricopeptide repeat protein, partial [Myxococcaceae bacterium]
MLGASAALAEDRLVPGVPVDATLAPGEPRVFLVDVNAGSALHLRLDHLHLDVVIRVRAPDGEVLGEASPFGTPEPVTLTVIVPRAGAQRVEARLRSPEARAGPFQIRIDPPHPATEADRRRIGAERKRSDADRLGDVDEAAGFPRMFELYRQSIDEFGALGDDFEQATALLLMADMLEQVNRLPEAQEALERALPLFRRTDEAASESRCLDELALVHTERGETHTALDLYAQALALRRAVGPHPWSEGRIINGMAIAYANLGDTVRAIDRYTEALPFAREAGDETAYAVALKNRGGQYLDLGDTERGMQDLEAARARFRALGKPREEGLAEFAIGTGWQNERQYDRALQSFQRALPLLEKAANNRFVALVLNHMGLVRLAQGHPDEATKLLADSLRRIEAGG